MYWISGGYVGVDVFFVISGYVITAKLVHEIEANRFSIPRFYAQRFRRIMPALVAVILASYVAALVLFLPSTMDGFSSSVIATALSVSNIYFWRNSGYFDIASLDKPLLHTWSLSVEEQFYVIIPIALYLLYRMSRRIALIGFVTISLCSLALSIFLTTRGPTANFYLLPTRAWELLIGSILVLARLQSTKSRWLNEILGAVGLGAIFVAALRYSDTTAFPGIAALLPTLGAALIIQSGGGKTIVERVLSWRPFVWIGLISYSLYLVHWPIIIFSRYFLMRNFKIWESGIIVAVSIGLAYLSWRFIEKPFRFGSYLKSDRRTVAASLAVLAGVAALGFVGVRTNGYQSRFAAAGLPQDIVGPTGTWKVGHCFLRDNQAASDWQGDSCVRTSGARPNALLWGDSFAAHYIPGILQDEARLTHNIVQYTFMGCPPILSYHSYARPGCAEFNTRAFDVIEKYHVDTVVMSARWDVLKQHGLSGLRETVDRLRSKGITVFVIGQSPVFDFDVGVLDYRHANLSKKTGTAAWYLSALAAGDSTVQETSSPATFIDPLSTFCRDQVCSYKTRRGLLFADYGHLSVIGSDAAVESYFPLLIRDTGVKSAAIGD